MKIVVVNTSPKPYWQFPEEIISKLKMQNEQVELTIVSVTSELKEHLSVCDYIIAFSFPKIFIKNNKNLKEIIFLSSAIPSSFTNDDKKTYKVSSLTGVNSKSVAQHALYLMMKGLRGDHLQSQILPRLLHKQNIGIIGYGAVGKDLYQLVSPLSSVSVITRQISTEAAFTDYSNYSDFLSKQDVIFITTALNDQTIQLYTQEKFFSKLSDHCLLINVARGELINEQTLIKYLNQNPKSYYLTDVTHPEPYPQDGALKKHKQVYITEHTAGTYEGVWDNIKDFLIAKVNTWKK